MVDTRVQFWDKESGKGSMISFIFLFVLFKVLVLSVNSHWDGTLRNCVRSASGLSQTFALEIVCLNELWGHIHIQMVYILHVGPSVCSFNAMFLLCVYRLVSVWQMWWRRKM